MGSNSEKGIDVSKELGVNKLGPRNQLIGELHDLKKKRKRIIADNDGKKLRMESEFFLSRRLEEGE